MRNAMDRITRQDLEYLESLHGGLPEVFSALDADGGRDDIPIVGTSVGRLLHMLVRASGARRVVEVGTAIGYSALWIATALPRDGQLITIDPDRERTDRARAFWDRAGVGDLIRVVNAPALDVLPTLEGPFDFAFIDALKHEYAGYLGHVVGRLRGGGTVAVDNLLWSGRTSGSAPDDGSTDTRALKEFNATFVAHRELDAVILPVGDGVGIGVKR
ncbi:MAG: O-methyltransferase [Chloroflexi bacterium]|nr:O-methyltransferase [Chloroflexota bacterium]